MLNFRRELNPAVVAMNSSNIEPAVGILNCVVFFWWTQEMFAEPFER
jgi:hypothetical protein